MKVPEIRQLLDAVDAAERDIAVSGARANADPDNPNAADVERLVHVNLVLTTRVDPGNTVACRVELHDRTLWVHGQDLIEVGMRLFAVGIAWTREHLS